LLKLKFGFGFHKPSLGIDGHGVEIPVDLPTSADDCPDSRVARADRFTFTTLAVTF
jgi:hypothetical protein